MISISDLRNYIFKLKILTLVPRFNNVTFVSPNYRENFYENPIHIDIKDFIPFFCF